MADGHLTPGRLAEIRESDASVQAPGPQAGTAAEHRRLLLAEVDRLAAELAELRRRLHNMADNIEASWPADARYSRSIARSLRAWAGGAGGGSATPAPPSATRQHVVTRSPEPDLRPLVVVVAGTPVMLSVDNNRPVRSIIRPALRETGNDVGQPPSAWEARDGTGAVLDLSRLIGSYPQLGPLDGRAFLNLRAGIGGSADGAAVDGEAEGTSRTLTVSWHPDVVRAAEKRLREIVHALAEAEGTVKARAAGTSDGALQVCGLILSWQQLACLADAAAAVVRELEPAKGASATPAAGRITVHERPQHDGGFAVGLQIGYAEGRRHG